MTMEDHGQLIGGLVRDTVPQERHNVLKDDALKEIAEGYTSGK